MSDNYQIATLSNGTKIVNLYGEQLVFEDGTVVEPEERRLNLRTIRRFNREPPNSELWRAYADDIKDPQIRLVKSQALPVIEDLEWIKKHIPKDVLIVTRTVIARSYGFPCVTPYFTNESTPEGRRIAKIRSFQWVAD